MKPKIVFIHSLNNFTGSPNVLSVVVNGFIKRGYRAEIITSRGEGFLSDIEGVRYRYTCYRWSNNQIVTLIFLLLSQLELFFRVFTSSRKHTYYINTIVPFGAILACKLTRKRYVIHVHENMRQSKPIYKIFRTVYSWCNTKSIFVSQYLKGTAVNCRDSEVIYNALPKAYSDIASEFLTSTTERGESILMVSSLRRFKGIYEFAELANRLPQYQFELVLSASESDVAQFAQEVGQPQNLKIYPMQSNLHPFYQRAKLLLQLSHPESWVETFGLTILEAMAYGVVAIVPNVGGPTELVENNYNGFTLNPHCMDRLEECVTLLMTDLQLYRLFSQRALAKAGEFNEDDMINKIERYIQ